MALPKTLKNIGSTKRLQMSNKTLGSIGEQIKYTSIRGLEHPRSSYRVVMIKKGREGDCIGLVGSVEKGCKVFLCGG